MEMIGPLFVEVMALAAVVAGLVIGAWWLAGVYLMRSREAEKDLPKSSLHSDLQEVLTGVPPVLKVFYAFILISLVGYVLYIWLGGVSY